MKLKFFAIIGPKEVTAFMQGFDVFPKDKIIAEGCYFTVATTFDELTDDQIRDVFDKLIKSLYGSYCVAYVEFVGSETNGRYLTNLDLRHQNPDVKVISSGEFWCTIEDAIKKLRT